MIPPSKEECELEFGFDTTKRVREGRIVPISLPLEASSSKHPKKKERGGEVQERDTQSNKLYWLKEAEDHFRVEKPARGNLRKTTNPDRKRKTQNKKATKKKRKNNKEKKKTTPRKKKENRESPAAYPRFGEKDTRNQKSIKTDRRGKQTFEGGSKVKEPSAESEEEDFDRLWY